MGLNTYPIYKHLSEPDKYIDFKGNRVYPDEIKDKMSKAGQHQANPEKNDKPCVQDMVIADINERKQVGIERYGTVLQPFNGRSALWDAYQEAIDLCQYLRQLIYEEEHNPDREWVHELRRKISLAKINAAVENHLHDRMQIAAEIMDTVENELAKHDN